MHRNYTRLTTTGQLMQSTDSSATASIAPQLPDGWQHSDENDSHLLMTNPASPFVVCVRPAGGRWAVLLRRRHASSQPELMLQERYERRHVAAEQALAWAHVISLTLAEVTDE
jgi:hypothetical protein